ncbi:hypothetical protein PybrP1_011586 [[Pythium] brassicae (nom. inval.)]|nr:hypothetical protein PybrP1_011586 [[Pythium] brassicae (nom. inval.)]
MAAASSNSRPRTNRDPTAPSSPLSTISAGSMPRQTQRCAGCGAFAEMCMGCFSRFRLQDGTAYKKQITRSVEMLFEKATARAFTKMSAVIVQWLFGVWKSAMQLNRWRRRAALRVLRRRRAHRWFATWHECIYKRRIVGAMLYAENQQQVAREKSREIALLHGDVFAIASGASVQGQLQIDELAKLRQVCAAQEAAILAKNQELLALRRELQDAKDRLVVLEKQAIDPKELERIKSESVDFKKVAFQLAGAMCQTMEAQVEQLATSEGRHNLSQAFSKEVLQTIDKPECQAFYNPLVELESVSAAAASSSGSSGSDATAASFFASYDAPTDRAEKILMQWVNALVQKHGPEWLPVPRMLNFHSSLTDGKLLVVLTKILHQAMCRVRPKRPPGAVSSKLEATSVLRENGEELTEIAMERYVEHMRKEESPEKRLELMIGTIGQALWLPAGLLNAKDILAGDAEFNFATLTYLFATFSPYHDEPFYALCSDLKMQLSSAKAKWRELREGPPAASTSSSTNDAIRRSRDGKEKEDSAGDDAALSSKMKLALAHTMELKRRIELEDQKTREGHVLWWKSIRIVLRKCFLSYARLARGKAGVLTRLDAAGDENEAFAKVPKHKLQDVELPFEDFAWETKLLQSFLLTIHCDLARIYRGYANRHGVVNEFLSAGDFMELLTECRVLDAHVTAADINAVLKRVDPKQTSASAHRALPPPDFLEALVRVARMKYTAECVRPERGPHGVGDVYERPVTHARVEEPKIRRLLVRFADELKELYARYAAEDPKKRRKRPRMTAFAFCQCLVDKGIQDASFSSEKVLALLNKVVRIKRETDAEGSGAGAHPGSSTASAAPTVPGAALATGLSIASIGATEDDEVAFSEFEEAMVAIACYKFPDPYISLESRVEKFFSFYIRGVRGDSATVK